MKSNRETPQDPTPVAFYLRRSLDDDEMQRHSLGAQEDILKASAESQFGRYMLIDKYVDSASGTKLDRPELQRMMRDARAGKFNTIFVYRVDRFSRNVKDLNNLVGDLDEWGVALKSATEPFDTSTISGRMMLQILASFAEFEHATIIERTRAGMRRKARKGEWPGGQVPYGYRLVTDVGLVPDDVEAPVVAELYRLYAVERFGGVNVAKELNRRGFRTRSGKRWHNKAVIDLLRRPIYAGLIRWGGVEQEGLHEAIVDVARWQAAQEILKARGEDLTIRLSNRSTFLLTGAIYCSLCGGKMVGLSGRKNGKKHCYYGCTTRQRLGKDQCPQQYVPALPLEASIIQRIRDVIGDKTVFERIVGAAQVKAGQQRPTLDAEIKALDARRAKAERRLDRYFTAFEAGDLDAATCQERVRALKAELADLEAERSAVNRRGAEAEMEPEANLNAFLRRFDHAMKKGAPPSKKKHLVRLLCPRIEVAARNQIDVFFRAPPSLVRLKGALAPLR